MRGYGSPSGRHRQGKYPSERRKIKTCRRVREAVVVGLRQRALEKAVSEKGGKKVGFRAGLRKNSEERAAESARAAVRPQGSEAPTRRCLRAVKKRIGLKSAQRGGARPQGTGLRSGGVRVRQIPSRRWDLEYFSGIPSVLRRAAALVLRGRQPERGKSPCGKKQIFQFPQPLQSVLR